MPKLTLTVRGALDWFTTLVVTRTVAAAAETFGVVTNVAHCSR